MSLILNIETATPICSVALGDAGSLLGCRETADDKSHASHLTVLIGELLEDCNRVMADLDAIAVSKGPGSYTGLRIGVSTAKGLCYALDIPLISVETLRSMGNALVNDVDQKTVLCPMIDARRMEVYTALYDSDLNEKEPTSAVVIDEHAFAGYLQKNKVLFYGDGADKCQGALGAHPNARFKKEFKISAASMVSLSESKFEEGVFEDVSYFEPYYLKDFVAGKPKKLI